MTLQAQQPTTANAPAVLTDEQRQRVADALESAQSENTRKNYASQIGKFRSWCEQEDYLRFRHNLRYWPHMQQSLPMMVRVCPRSGLQPRLSSTRTGTQVWNLHRPPV